MDPRLPKGLACLVVVLLVTLTASPGALGQQGEYGEEKVFTKTDITFKIPCVSFLSFFLYFPTILTP